MRVIWLMVLVLATKEKPRDPLKDITDYSAGALLARCVVAGGL
jgi:hypothetical protein